MLRSGKQNWALVEQDLCTHKDIDAISSTTHPLPPTSPPIVNQKKQNLWRETKSESLGGIYARESCKAMTHGWANSSGIEPRHATSARARPRAFSPTETQSGSAREHLNTSLMSMNKIDLLDRSLVFYSVVRPVMCGCVFACARLHVVFSGSISPQPISIVNERKEK